MKNTDLFDIFENAEDELMEDLTEMSPEISDERLEELLAVSERNYKMKKKEYERTRKDKNKEYDGAVSGVERVKRPVWLAPLVMAASLVLIAGVVLGSTALLRRHGKSGGVTPDLTAVTTTADKNGEITTTKSGSTVTVTTTKAGSTTAVSGTNTAAAAASGQTDSTTSAASAAVAETTAAAAANETASGEQELERYAFDLYKRSEIVNDKINGIGVSGYGEGFLKVSVDPGLGYRSYDYEHNNSQWVDNVKFYLPAADENFTTADELRSYVRSAFTQNSFVYRWLEDNLITAPDDFENGGYLDSGYLGHFLIYRGKLYMTAPGGGKGSLEPEYSEAYPVIITNKTDTSFTAYVAEWYGGSEPYYDLNEATCAEVKYVLDPEFNDWRINDIVTRPPGVYKELYDSRNN